MRNMAVLHSPAFSYPLPVLVRVLFNLLIFKGKILYYNKYTHNNNAYHCFLIYISITKCMPSFDRLNGLNKNKGYSELFTK